MYFDYFRSITILLIIAGHSYGPWTRNNFLEIWQGTQNELEDLVKKLQIRLLKIRTDEDVYLKLKNSI